MIIWEDIGCSGIPLDFLQETLAISDRWFTEADSRSVLTNGSNLRFGGISGGIPI